VSDFQVFLPIAKVDVKRRTVSGYASTPTKDGDGEIVTLEAIKKALPDYMEYGNIREMHALKAVGVALEGNIDAKGLYVTAFIKDDAAWAKCQPTDLGNGQMAGAVYKGFSIGGRKMDKVGNKITEIDLTEISIVDRPSNPDCKINLAKSAKILNDDQGGFLVKVKNNRSPEQKALAKMARIVEDLAKAGPPAAHDGFSLPAKMTGNPSPKDGQEDKNTVLKAYDGAEPCEKHGQASCSKCMGKVSGGDPKKPYGDVEYADPGHQADGKSRYPVDNEGHIRAAWNYINKPKNAAKYPEGKAEAVKSKITAAWKKKIHKDGPPSAGEAKPKEAKEEPKEATAEAKKAAKARMLKVLSLAPNDIIEAPVAAVEAPFLTLGKAKQGKSLSKGMGTAGSLSYVFDSLRSAQRSLLMEAKREGGDMKDKGLAKDIGDIAKQVASVISQKAMHEGGEAVSMTDADDQFLSSMLGEDFKMSAMQGEGLGFSSGDPLADALAKMMKRAATPSRAMRMAAAEGEVKKSRKACKAAKESIEEVHKLLKASYLSKATKKDKGGDDKDGEFDHADAMEKLQKAYGEIEKARTFGKAAIGQIQKAASRAGQQGQEAGDAEPGFFEVPPGVKDLTPNDLASAGPGGKARGSAPPEYPVDGGVFPGKAAGMGDLAKFAKNGQIPMELVGMFMEKTRMEGELEALRNMPAGGGSRQRPYAFDIQKAYGTAASMQPHGGGGGFSPSGATPQDLNKALFEGVNPGALNSGDERSHVEASAKVIGNFLTSGHFGKSVFDPAFKGAAGTNR
jgi:hypothetical protein